MPKPPDHRRVLGAAIREQRQRAGLSQERLAEAASLHPNYLGRVERGEEHISLTALLRIARALGVKLQHLVRDL